MLAQVGIRRSQTPEAAHTQRPEEDDPPHPGSRESSQSQEDPADASPQIFAPTVSDVAPALGAVGSAVDDHAAQVDSEDEYREGAGHVTPDATK